MDADHTAWDRDLDNSPGVRQAIGLDLSIRRTLQRIDRALDAHNRREFTQLCQLLKQYKAKR